MKKKDLTNEQFSSICCPTCGVGVSEPCVWNSGESGFGAHLNRKLSALDGIDGDKPIDNISSAASSDDEGPFAYLAAGYFLAAATLNQFSSKPMEFASACAGLTVRNLWPSAATSNNGEASSSRFI